MSREADMKKRMARSKMARSHGVKGMGPLAKKKKKRSVKANVGKALTRRETIEKALEEAGG